MKYYKKRFKLSQIKIKEATSPATKQERMQAIITLTSDANLFSSSSISGNNIKTGLKLTSKVVGEWTATREARCMVCWVKIKPGESVTTCRHCGSQAHANHLDEWFRSKRSRACPRCRRLM
ncbi:MAG: hypothetical protein ACXAEU_07790 [Candidatus Hodarchaeales archaeon]